MNRIKKAIEYIEAKSTQLLIFWAVVVVVIIAMAALSVLQLLMGFETDSIIPMILSIIYLIIILFYAKKFPHKLELFKMMALMPMVLLFIPYLYMGTLGGGIKSGMPIWMVLGLLMICFFTKGIYYIVSFTLTLLLYIGCIAFSYNYMQDRLGQLEEIYYYQDTVIALVAVVVSCGIILKYQQRVEARSKKKIEQEKLNAQNANAAKSKFLTNMSHDIRTPMNAIIGMTEMANYNIDDKEKVQECLKKINDSSTMLLHLINNVLDMSEIESHELRLKESSFELKEMIEKIHIVLEQSALSKRQFLEVSCENISDNRLIGDVVRLRQVLMNLLSNSLKFTPAGGAVSLKVRQEGAKDGYASFVIEVKDTGIGMKKEFIEKGMFEPFKRGNAEYVDKTEGNGIGMSITKNILDIMQADLQIDSEVGRGTTFTIRIDLKIDSNKTNEKNEEPGVKKLPDLSGKRLLVVEDNEINMEIVVSLLERINVEVVQAWNAEDAVKYYEDSAENYFDLILFDIQLPGMNGYEGVKIIRAMDRADAKNVPIFAMTANAFSHDVEESLTSGMNEHLSKPLDIDVLYKRIQQYIG